MIGSFFTLAISSIVSSVIGVDQPYMEPVPAPDSWSAQSDTRQEPMNTEDEWMNVINDEWNVPEDEWANDWTEQEFNVSDDWTPLDEWEFNEESAYGLNSGYQVRPSRRNLITATKAQQNLRTRTRSNVNDNSLQQANFRFLRDRNSQQVANAPRQVGASKSTTNIIRARTAETYVDTSRKSNQQRYTVKQFDPDNTAAGSIYANNIERIAPSDHMWGHPSAKVTMIVYMDLECPACKTFHPTIEQALNSYGSSLNVVYRHMPITQIHENALGAALATECAYAQEGDKGFWKYVEHVFDHGADESMHVSYARDLGLDYVSFNKCLENETYLDRVWHDVDTAKSAGATGTPWTVIVNNETGAMTTLMGVVPFYDLESTIDDFMSE